VLTTDQKNQAFFWRDVPGVSTPGHWMSITQQAIRQSKSRLDKAAGAYALTGICLNDAVISVFHYKYIYLNVRPITYIHNVIGDAGWAPQFATPNHPEYPAAHAYISSAAAEGLTAAFGNIGPLTDHTWDYRDSRPVRSTHFASSHWMRVIPDFMLEYIISHPSMQASNPEQLSAIMS
jgi:hypothetical protein